MRYRVSAPAGLLGTGPVRPLVCFFGLAFGTVLIESSGTDWSLVAVAGLTAVCLAALAAIVAWSRLPASLLVVPALGTLLVVAILRQSQGGSRSGYAPLVMLPLVWLALVLGRRAVLAMVAGTTVTFALPLLIYGPPMYPASGWRATVLWMVVTSSVGFVVASVVEQRRREAAGAQSNAVDLEQTLAALHAIASVARDISSGADARERVCAAAVSSTNAILATVIERRDGAFAITGSAGIPFEPGDLQDPVEPSASLAAYFSQARVFIADASANPGVSPLIVQRTGLGSILYEPIVRHGRPVGVLSVGWSPMRETLDAKTLAVVSFLAAEAASAIERSDLLGRLDAQARTDELTTLPNRRAWDVALERAVDGAARACVAMIDIDYFKQYNDEHGHVAGDELLRESARAWERQLRPGDLLARYGGEEFAMLLHDCALADARAVLERVRRATPRGVTCSVGIAERRFPDAANDLVERADDALYTAKRAGRNQLRAA